MNRSDKSMPLRDGARVVVIGGGPAGSIFACQLLGMARQRGLHLSLTILDRKRFLREGPPGCNLCAGVVCTGLLENLRSLGIELPEDLRQSAIEGYRLQTQAGVMHLARAAAHGPIVAIYRGNGPRSELPHPPYSFDDFLLKHALGRGTQLLPVTAAELHLPASPSAPAAVSYLSEGVGCRIEADLVVAACGVNSTFPAVLERAGFGYRRPRARRACQVEIPLPEDFIKSRFGGCIHLFALGLERIRFAALVPKRHFATLTLIGHGDLEADDLRSFLTHPEVQAYLPPGWRFDGRFCHCSPLMPVSPARSPLADRIVVIGDAAVSRYYKNGLGSAYATATLAANAVIRHGVSAAALREHYWNEARRQIARDNTYGRALFAVVTRVSKSRRLAAVCNTLAQDQPHRSVAQAFHHINWNLATGDEPYRQVARSAVSPAFLLGVLAATGRTLLKTWRPRRRVARAGPADLGPLRDGQTVAIVGGGPAGVSCAITLKRMALQRRMELEVLLYEAKDFESAQQYNQCAGLLSPPIVEVLRDQLGVQFPFELVQRRVNEYLLHGPSESIRLAGRGEDSLALRRVLFDRYLLRQAILMGVRIVHSRMQDLEVNADHVRIFSDSGSQRADAVVGAFGLDDGAAQAFSRATGYRQPNCMETLVTKFHPPAEQMARIGQTAHAFLPPMAGVEFAAVVPKGNHLAIVIAGRRLNTRAIDELLDWEPMRQVVRREECREQQPEYYKGRFPASEGRRVLGRRYVMVGDAAGLVRPFKGKGVTTACLTGHMAAVTMMDVGIDERAMGRFYANCHELTDDILIGRLVRRAVGLARRAGAIDELIRQARHDEALQEAMYCCVSGEGTLRQMLKRSMGIKRICRAVVPVVAGLARNLGLAKLSRWWSRNTEIAH